MLFGAFLMATAAVAPVQAQINTDRVLTIGRNALYYEDYVLSIQYFNQVIRSKPNLAEPYLYRGIAKYYLDDYTGAEQDMTECIARNPFIWMAYQVRGSCRQSLGKYKEAIEDYDKGMEFRPEDRFFLFGKGTALAQLKEYDESIEMLSRLIRFQSKFIPAYLTRGAVYEETGDSIQAMSNYNAALEIDKYYAPTYERRAMLYFKEENYDAALDDMNEAIRLEPRQLGYHINRGLVRFYNNDLRGAMADYDQAISIDRNNIIARFNRGILRNTVGDKRGAIEDFDVIIEQEPDNYIALYNRAILNMENKDYRNALADLGPVLEEYPNFLQGYYFRSSLKRQMGDLRGAESDYWMAQDMEKAFAKLRKEGKTITAKAILDSGEEVGEDDDKVRERSDDTIEKFGRLIVYDKEEEAQSKYQSQVRGRVQDRQVQVDMEPQFVITYYEPVEEIDRSISRTNKQITDFNNRHPLRMQLRMTNHEASLTDSQAEYHFNSINEYSLIIKENPHNAVACFARGLDYMILQDFSEAIKGYDEAIAADTTFIFAYFNRAATRYKQFEIDNSRKGNADPLDLKLDKRNDNLNLPSSSVLSLEGTETGSIYRYDLIILDYNRVIELQPDFFYAYFNRGNIRCLQNDYRLAIADYSEAIKINPDFAEAYFNRGLTHLYLGNKNKGIEDLSKAGELGMFNAYNIIKKMTSE